MRRSYGRLPGTVRALLRDRRSFRDSNDDDSLYAEMGEDFQRPVLDAAAIATLVFRDDRGRHATRASPPDRLALPTSRKLAQAAGPATVVDDSRRGGYLYQA